MRKLAAFLLVVLFPLQAFAAITFDTSFKSAAITATTWTQAYTVGAGSNGLMLVACNYSTTTGSDPMSSLTYNGITLHEFQYKDDNTTEGSMGVYYGLLGTTDGASHNLSANAGTVTIRYCIIASYLGVNQSGFPDASGTGSPVLQTTAGTSFAASVTSVANNSWGFLYFQNGTAQTAGANTTIRQQLTGQVFTWSDTNGPQTPAGAFTMNLSFASSKYSAIFGSFAPAVAAAVAVPVPIFSAIWW